MWPVLCQHNVVTAGYFSELLLLSLRECACSVLVLRQDSKAVVEHLASLQRRCHEQLHLLRSLISRCWNMRVPVFPPFTRADKNEYKKQQDRSRQTAGSSVGSSASGGSDTQANTASTWHHPGIRPSTPAVHFLYSRTLPSNYVALLSFPCW